MPPDATASEADNNNPPPPAPPPDNGKGGKNEKVPPKVLERMRRVSPDMARRYNQRGGQ